VRTPAGVQYETVGYGDAGAHPASAAATITMGPSRPAALLVAAA
jgi:hypothetical protein